MSALAYCDRKVSATDASSYTFADFPFGAEEPTRLMVAGIVWRTSGTSNTISGVTIGGVTATRLAFKYNDGGSRSAAECWVAAVPTGTTGSVVVQFGATAVRCGVALYALTGLSSSGIAAQNGVNSGSFTLPLSTPAHVLGVSLSVSASGYRLGSARADLGIGTPSLAVSISGTNITWTGLTEDADILIENTAGTTEHAALVVAWTMEAQGIAAGDLPLSGSATGQVAINGSASGFLPLTGHAEGTVEITGVAASSLPLTGTATGSVEITGSASGVLPLMGSATGSVDSGEVLPTLRPTVGRPRGYRGSRRPVQVSEYRPPRIAVGRR